MFVSNEEKLKTAIASGNAHKGYHRYGKEYYALYTGHMSDAILEFVAKKIEALHPTGKDCYVSTVGVTHNLFATTDSVFQVVDRDFLYIHKAKFKRHLKKAICRNRNKH